jgi:predicted dehydrogenase
MAPKTIRVGWLGCGRIADLQCLGYLDHPRAEIVAVCDSDASRARARAEKWGARRSYADAETLWADPEVDAVEIGTPHHLHEAHAIAALDSGKHVSLQKPPTRTLEELDRVASAAERSGRVLRIFENFSHYPPHRKAKALVDAGEIGTPLSVRAAGASRPSTTATTASRWPAGSFPPRSSACTRSSTGRGWENGPGSTVRP